MSFYKPPILLYHRVAKEGDPTMTVSPTAFRRQVEHVARQKERVIPLDRWVEGILGEGDAVHQPLMITFDDGHLETFTEAFPVLHRHHLSATLFMVTDWIGRDGFLTWGQLQVLADAGWTIGSHTKSHPYLPELSVSKWEEEIRGSKEILEEGLKCPVTLFSYPIGGFTEEMIPYVERAGYRAACTTNRGPSRSLDRYRLTRIKMTESSHPFVLWAKTSGYYEHFKRPKPSH